MPLNHEFLMIIYIFRALGEIACESFGAFPGQRVYKSVWLIYPHGRAFPVRFANLRHLPAGGLRNNVLMYEPSNFLAYLPESHIF